MRRVIFIIPVLVSLFAGYSLADPDTQIRYDIADLGSGRWQYTYEVKNIALPMPVEEFTIWFDYGQYSNLTVATPDPLASNWRKLIVQPEPVLKDNGFYDAFAKGLSIGMGETVTGFSVTFNWLGTGNPGSQFYEIVNPSTFETIGSGWTTPVPEPAMMLLLGMGSVFLRGSRK
jgi:hypothetical protein